MNVPDHAGQASWLSQPWVSGLKGRIFCLLVAVVALFLVYRDSLIYLVRIWINDENYGHGLFVPLISAYLVWQQREALFRVKREGTWIGFGLVLVALALYFLGEFSTLYFLLHLSFWLMVCGMAAALVGWKGVKIIAFPLFFLLTMIPLPQFVLQSLSTKLQLFSSWLGVECLKLVGVMAFREGNVIDLGPIQLQVAEACSGLRALFPLMTLALICAYVLKGPLWKRAILFLSSIPIAIVLNGFRIGVVGLLVEQFGVVAAEGFYHFFEGWVLFVVSLAILVMVMWALGLSIPLQAASSCSASRSGSLDGPDSHRGEIPRPASVFPIPRAYVCSVLLLAPVLLASTHISDRREAVPGRTPFLDFPMEVDEWTGQPYPMEQIYINTLRFDDYLLADYRRGTDPPVNVYLAYYHSQKKGQSVHSPSTCIPGGGWEIESLQTVELGGMGADEGGWPVNRVLIRKGDYRQVVYYWFLQRGRILTNEYWVKAYLFWDALTRNRSDGALVRLTVPITAGGGDFEAEEERLRHFALSVQPLLSTFIPD